MTDPVTKCPQWSDSCPTRLTPVDALGEPTVTTVAAPVLAAAPVVTERAQRDNFPGRRGRHRNARGRPQGVDRSPVQRPPHRVGAQHPVQDRLVHMQLRVPVPGVVLLKRGDDELVASIHCPALAPCPTRA